MAQRASLLAGPFMRPRVHYAQRTDHRRNEGGTPRVFEAGPRAPPTLTALTHPPAQRNRAPQGTLQHGAASASCEVLWNLWPNCYPARVLMRLEANGGRTPMTMRPDPTFHASPKLAMEAPPETSPTRCCSAPTSRSPTRSRSSMRSPA